MRRTTLVLVVLLCGCPSANVKRKTVVLPVVYGQGETGSGDIDLDADLYLPVSSRSPVPALIVFHGGGWMAAFGEREFSADFSSEVASSGIAVLNCDYRLNEDDPIVSASDEKRFQDAYPFLPGETAAAAAASCEDMRSAVRWLKANAAVYNIDPDRILVGGFSAGAITALTCLYAPRTEFVSTHASNKFSEAHAVAGAVAISGSAEVALNEGWIDGFDRPAMIWHGDMDTNVYTAYDPFITGLCDALKGGGAPYDAYIEAGGGHFDYATHNGLTPAETVSVWIAKRTGNSL